MGELGLSAEDKAITKAGVKYLLPAACAVALLFASLVGTRVMEQQEYIAKRLEALQIDMAVVKTDVQYLKRGLAP